jgi:peptidylprolyl isomerase
MIQNGQFATVHYTGTLADGEIFDSTDGREPFEFEIGQGRVIPAFEDTIKNMNPGEEKNLNISAGDAYGEYREDLTQRVPLSDVKQFLEPTAGMVIQVMLSDNNNAPALIKEVTAEEVVLDFNHPLAGKDLTFKLNLVSVNDVATQDHSCDDENCESCGGTCG